MSKKVYIFLADGFEDIEGLTVVDLLRRAEIEIHTVSIKNTKEVQTAHGISLLTDKVFGEVDFSDADMLVLPGGMPGTLHLGDCEGLKGFLMKAAEENGRIAAICAAPTVLGKLGLLNGRKAICYPGMEDGLTGAEVTVEPVVTDGNITTSRGLGTAIPFALRLIEELSGKETADRIAESVVYQA